MREDSTKEMLEDAVRSVDSTHPNAEPIVETTSSVGKVAGNGIDGHAVETSGVESGQASEGGNTLSVSTEKSDGCSRTMSSEPGQRGSRGGFLVS